jgi:hypothetical protein
VDRSSFSSSIVIGPVLMIVIVSTISVYLAVYNGVPMAAPADVDEKPKRRRLLGWFARRGGKNKPTPAPAPALALAPAN